MSIQGRLFALILLISVFSYAYCQSPVDEGVINLSGSLSFKSDKPEKNNEIRKVSLSPAFGYFIKDKLLLGLAVNSSTTQQNDFEATQLSVGPYLKYFFPIKNIYYFTGINYQYSISESYNGSNSELDRRSQVVILSNGLSVFLAKNIALEPSFGIKGYHKNSEGSNFLPKNDGTGVEYSLNVRLSIFLY